MLHNLKIIKKNNHFYYFLFIEIKFSFKYLMHKTMKIILLKMNQKERQKERKKRRETFHSYFHTDDKQLNGTDIET